MTNQHIRNFSIIAHIDHGKSTIADRLIENTGTLSKREMEAQVLDNMDIERERGITIKSQTVRLKYKGKDGEEYELNLIDTPGHVDFTYEVSRSLAACEGALLVVDAAQGVEAQTLANVYMALENDLEIIPVINKIDLPSADPERVKKEIEDVIGLDTSNAIECSAKTGQGIDEILDAIVDYVPAPEGDENAPLQALIFDSYFDSYKGVIAHIRVKQGHIKKGMKLKMMATGKVFEVTDVGTFGTTSVDYPDIAEKVCADVVSGKSDRGIALCGTGIGISIACNKIKGIRCALCNDVYSAKMSRHHNDANVLAMGGRVLGNGPAGEIVRAWVETGFDGGRHERRVNKIMALEQK